MKKFVFNLLTAGSLIVATSQVFAAVSISTIFEEKLLSLRQGLTGKNVMLVTGAQTKPDVMLRQTKLKYLVARVWTEKNTQGVWEYKSEKVCSGDSQVPVYQIQDNHALSGIDVGTQAPISCSTRVKNHGETDAKPSTLRLFPSVYIYPQIPSVTGPNKFFMTEMHFNYVDTGIAARDNAVGIVYSSQMTMRDVTLDVASADIDYNIAGQADHFDANVTLEDSAASDIDGVLLH